MTVKNSGTSVITIDTLILNGKPVSTNVKFNGGNNITLNGSGDANNIITLDQGDGGIITFGLVSGTTYKSGMSIEMTFHTVSGKEYPKVVVIP